MFFLDECTETNLSVIKTPKQPTSGRRPNDPQETVKQLPGPVFGHILATLTLNSPGICGKTLTLRVRPPCGEGWSCGCEESPVDECRPDKSRLTEE